MRIAHALQMPLLQQGGVEVLVRTLIADLPAEDEVFLVSQDDPETLAKSSFGPRLVDHFPVPTEGIQRGWSEALLAWVRDNGIELCHFHLSGTYGWRARSWINCPITILGRAGVPVVTTNHQGFSYFDSGGPPKPYWRRWAAAVRDWPGKSVQLAAVLWEVSVSLHDLAMSRHQFPFSRTKLFQIYHSRLDSSLEARPLPHSKTILNVGTIAFRKGQHLLVNAFAKIAGEYPEWRLNLVGMLAENTCVAQIHQIIDETGLENRVQLHGTHDDPSPFFRNAEIYVQPSLIEGLGLSLQEAMFHGCACIGADCGGIPELVADPSMGKLFAKGDVDALADVLRSLMEDREERLRLGAAARTSILDRGMTRQAMSARYQKEYSRARSSDRP